MLTTVEQVRRIFRIVAGFTLLLVGVVMLVTPGPGLAGDLSRSRAARRGICLGAPSDGPDEARRWQVQGHGDGQVGRQASRSTGRVGSAGAS